MLLPIIHENDVQNMRKHEKMLRRTEKGTVNQNCKWYKRRHKK